MKKSKIIIALLMVAVMTLSLCLFVSCNKDTAEVEDTETDSTTIEATEGLIITNGDFKVTNTDSETYPLTLSDWTGATQYSTGFNTDVTAGVVSLEEALYEANKSNWNDEDKTIYNLLKTGDKYGDNDKIKNALMIYMPTKVVAEDETTTHGPTAYGYTSSSFTLEKASYYQLSVDVLTYNIAGEESNEPGARIYVSTNTYAEFSAINTNGLWKTYNVYIETSPSSSTSLSLLLGLGKYTSDYTDGLTTGYVFFDNVNITKLEDTDTKTAEEQYNDGKALEAATATSAYNATATLKVPNGRFDFGTTSISSSANPSNWSIVTGNSSEDDKAPTTLGWNGIFDLTKFSTDYNTLSTSYTLKDSNGVSQTAKPAQYLNEIDSLVTNQDSSILGSNVYVLSQAMMTAQGIKSSKTITIEKGKTYALSIDLYTFDIHGAGVSLILTGSNSKDIIIEGITSNKSTDVFVGRNIIDYDSKYISQAIGATTSSWNTYTFYIKGNEYKDYEYNMAIWLGTKGTNSNIAYSYKKLTSSDSSGSDSITYTANGTFSNGWVFIDELNLNEINALPSASTSIVDGGDSLKATCDTLDSFGLIVDLTSTNLMETVFDSATANTSTTPNVTKATQLGTPTGWTTDYDTTKAENAIIKDLITDGLVDISSKDNFTTSGGLGTYPDLPYEILNKKAYMIYASQDSSYSVNTAEFTIEKNKFYRLSMWVKTTDVKDTAGASIELYNDETSASSFTSINTTDSDEYTNDWVEYTFIIRGEKDEDVQLFIKLSLGSGDRWSPSTLATGGLFVTNIDLETITYSTFNSTSTGTYVKSYNMYSSYTYTFTNGSFDSYDMEDENWIENQTLENQEYAITPSNWTLSDETEANIKDSENKFTLVAGTIALTEANGMYGKSTQSMKVVPALDSTNFYEFDPASDPYTVENLNKVGGPYLLTIASNDSAKKYAVGYASDSKSLSANSYYKLSVYVKAIAGTKASIYLSSDSSTDTTAINYFKVADTTWTQYTFYVKVGKTSTSVKMNLWLGYNTDYIEKESDTDPEDYNLSNGAVFFDNVTYYSISADDYKNATEGTTLRKLAFATETFDTFTTSTSTRSSLSTVSDWTGAADTDQDSSNTESGIAYCDDQYYETKDEIYVKYFGADYSVDDITLTDQDIVNARDSYPGKTDTEIATLLKEKQVADQKAANWLPVSELTSHSGKSILAINNTVESAYSYTSSSITMDAESYYKVSIWVKTYKTSENAGAYIELYLGDANDDDNLLYFEKVTASTWTEYSFYVETLNDEVSSITLKVSLGKYHMDDETDEITGLSKGYLFIDDFTVEKMEDMDATEFEAKANDPNTKTRTVSYEEEGTADDEDSDEDTTETDDKSFNLEYLWWMIPTIILGLLTIIVVVVWIVKKVAKPYLKKKEKEANNAVESNTLETSSLDEKHSKYDESKE